MRYIASILALLIALALPAGAADLRPSAITTDDTELVGLKGYIKALNRSTCKQAGLLKNCTDAEVKAVDPTLKVYGTNNSGVEDYWRDNLLTLKAAMISSDAERQAKQDLVEAWSLATPAQKAAALAALPVLP